jgi:hypothetical protein
MPVVPWATVISGRPSSGASAVGTEARPVTAMGSPATDSDRYMIRYVVAPANAGSSITCERINVPCGPSGSGSGTS